ARRSRLQDSCIAQRRGQGLGCDGDRGGNVGHMVADVAHTFAANRAVGSIALAVRASAGATRRSRVREEGPLRVRCPGPTSAELEAVIVNTAGGVAGGDRFALGVTVEACARLVVTTAAAEKVYRTLAPEATIDVKLDVAAGGSLAWLPQETILFDRARLKRAIDVDLAEDARLVLAEAIVFGRSGMGEAVHGSFLFDRWRLRRGGRLMHAEALRLDGAVAGGPAPPPGCQGGAPPPTGRGRARGGGTAARRAAPRACARSAIVCAARSASPPGTGSPPCGSAPPTAKRCAMISLPCSPRCAARRCRGCGSTEANASLKASHESDPARKGQVAHLHGCDGGAPAAGARRQAQSYRGGGAHPRFHPRRCTRWQNS